MAMADFSMWHFVGISWKIAFMHTETPQISNLRSHGVSKETLSDSVRKDLAEFNKFCHFQYATLEMFKGVFNNYSMLKMFWNSIIEANESNTQDVNRPFLNLIPTGTLIICLYLSKFANTVTYPLKSKLAKLFQQFYEFFNSNVTAKPLLKMS